MFANSQLPNIFLRLNINNITEVEYWPYPSVPEDPWASNPYRWEIEAVVQTQIHSSPFSRIPFQYDGEDIKVGMWIGSGDPVKAVKIISITSQASDSIVAVVEDVERFNTFSDSSQSGTGIFSTGDGYSFQIAEDGLPLIYPIDPSFPLSTFFSNDLISRFRINNPRFRFRFDQVAHGFQVGDEIYLDPVDGLFKLLEAGEQPIGRVVDVSDSPDTFLVSPVNRIDEAINLPLGVPGNIFYYDDTVPGGLTLTPNSRAAYLKLSDTSAMILEEGINPPPVSVYPTLASRPATSKVGHLAYVTDVGNGEWAMYVYTVDGWVVTATQDSARTDALTLDVEVDVNSTSPIEIGKISTGRRVTLITVTVEEEFDGNPVLSMQDTVNNVELMSNSLIDLSQLGIYSTSSDYYFDTGSDTTITATFDPGGATQGLLKITLTYV